MTEQEKHFGFNLDSHQLDNLSDTNKGTLRNIFNVCMLAEQGRWDEVEKLKSQEANNK